VAINLRKPFKYIFENKEQAEKQISRVRTSPYVGNKGHFALMMAKCPTLSGVVDDVRTFWMTVQEQEKFLIPKLSLEKAEFS